MAGKERKITTENHEESQLNPNEDKDSDDSPELCKKESEQESYNILNQIILQEDNEIEKENCNFLNYETKINSIEKNESENTNNNYNDINDNDNNNDNNNSSKNSFEFKLNERKKRNFEENKNENFYKKQKEKSAEENLNSLIKPNNDESNNWNVNKEQKANQDSLPFSIKEAANENKESAFQRRKRGSSGIEESEYFKMIRSETSCNLRKQILKMQNRADKYVEKLYKNAHHFQEIKKELLSKKCKNIFNTFSLFNGFNWRINLKRTNFFNLAAKAWILEVFHLLENYIKTNLKKQSEAKKNQNTEGKENEITTTKNTLIDNYPTNFTFAGIIKKIAKTKIDEQSFLLNLSVLTGSVYSQSYLYSTTKLIENNIGILFLNSINKILHQLEITDALDDGELDQRKFESLLDEILRKAVEQALNSMDSQASEQPIQSSFINYFQCFEKLNKESKENNVKNFDYKNYLLILEKENVNFCKKSEFELKFNKCSNHKNKFENDDLDDNNNSEAISRDFSNKICAETFFDFCGYKFPMIVEDLRIFIKEYFSLHFRLKNLFAQTMTKVVDYNKKYINLFKAIYKGILNKLKAKIIIDSDTINHLYQYYHKKFPKAFEVINKQKDNVKNTYMFCRDWVNSSVNLVKSSSSYILKNFFYEKYKLIYATFINPIYSLSKSISNNMPNKVIFFKISNCSACLISFQKYVWRLVAFIRKNINQAVIGLCESTIGLLGIYDKIKFLKETNDKDLIEFCESENKEYLIVKVNSKLIGNLLYKLKAFRLDLIRTIIETYKGAFKKAFVVQKALISFSNKKRLEALGFIKAKFEEIIEAE